jgi:hypothetical protein
MEITGAFVVLLSTFWHEATTKPHFSLPDPKGTNVVTSFRSKSSGHSGKYLHHLRRLTN